MMKQKRYTAESKAKVALEAIRAELTTAELSRKYAVHPTMIKANVERHDGLRAQIAGGHHAS